MLRRLLRLPAAGTAPRRTRLGFDRLEDRCVPAITASVSNGILTVTGDNGNNFISISEDSQPARYSVSDGMLIGGGGVFDGVSSIVVDTLAGSDSISFLGNPFNTVGLTGALQMVSSGVANFSIFDNVDVAGRTTVQHTGTGTLNFSTSGSNLRLADVVVTDGNADAAISLGGGTRLGNASFALGGGNNTVTLDRAAVNGVVSFAGAAGTDVLALQNGTTVTGGVTASVGTGTNQITVHGATLLGGVSYNTSGSNDTAEVALGSVVKGVFSVKGSAATNSLAINVLSNSQVGGLTAVTGSGGETVQIDSSSVKGGVDLNLGAGAAALTINAASVSGNFLQLGTGTLDVNVGGASRFLGYVSFNGTGAGRVLANFNGNSSVDGFLSIAGGSADDVVNLGASTVIKNFATALGAGANSATLDNASVRGGVLLTGTGTETYTLRNGTRLQLALTVNTPATTTPTTVTIDNASLPGGTITTGSGNDSVQLLGASAVPGTLTAKLGNGTTNSLVVDNSHVGLLVHFGSGTTEQVSLRNGTAIDRYLSVNAGTTSAVDVNVSSSSIYGALSVVSGSGGDVVTVSGSDIGTPGSTPRAAVLLLGQGASNVTVLNSQLSGRFDVSAGGTTHAANFTGTAFSGGALLDYSQASGGLDFLATASHFAAELTVRTNSGADTIRLIRSTSTGPTSLTTGAGNDVFVTDGAEFDGSFTANFGAGNDAFNIERNAFMVPNSTNTSFNSRVQVFMGDGDDAVNLGLSDSDLALFFAFASFDGGVGSNALDQTFARYFGETPTFTGF